MRHLAPAAHALMLVAAVAVACGPLGDRPGEAAVCARTAITPSATTTFPPPLYRSPKSYATLGPQQATSTPFQSPTPEPPTATAEPPTSTPTVTPTLIPPPPDSARYRLPPSHVTEAPRAPLPRPGDIRVGKDGCYYAEVGGYRWDESARGDLDGRLWIHLTTPSLFCEQVLYDPLTKEVRAIAGFCVEAE